MLEGFGLWFDAVATRVLNVKSRDPDLNDVPYAFPPDLKPSTSVAGAGAATPGRVAQQLWDIMDVHGTNDGMEIQDVDADAIKEFRDPDLTYSQDLNRRYAKAASYFFDAPTNEDFNFMWMNRIKTKLTDSQESYHCKVIIYNTLNVSGFNCD